MTKVVRTIRSMGGLFVALVLLAAAAGFLAAYHAADRPPAHIENLFELDGVAVKDGAIDVFVSGVVRTRDCDVRVDWFLWRDTGALDKAGKPVRRWVSLKSEPPPPVELNVLTSYVYSLPLPPNVDAGAWHILPRARDLCGPVPALDSPSRMGPESMVVILPPSQNAGPVAPEVLLSAPPVVSTHSR